MSFTTVIKYFFVNPKKLKKWKLFSKKFHTKHLEVNILKTYLFLTENKHFVIQKKPLGFMIILCTFAHNY
ncbi:hypothetical protein CCYN2B_220025 [Capnocytophaga cynodegmi]|uniref:Uncharacterized protein n=1 Tax=Capnocytophaga cynodegmi TaxID=28189 RepID=A0A0B7H4W0_9FLAO|nr:hypothetical protein CCYN2B_220025 [Capnocytophaga cynodegmi]